MAGGLSLICGVLRERRLASPTTRCAVNEYKLLPLPLQGLYRGLQGRYSALQAFSALAGRILWLFVALMGQRVGIVHRCAAFNCELYRCKAKLLATIGTAGESRGEATATPGAGVSRAGQPCVLYLSGNFE